VVAGAGAAGTGVALALHRSGWPVDALACRSVERAQERVALLDTGRALSLEQLCAEQPADGAARLLLIAVPDHAIAELASHLSRRPWAPDSVALHLSGSVEVAALQPLRDAGLAVGGCHPLKSFVDPQRAAETMADTVFALEGDAAAAALAEQLAHDLHARPFTLRPGRRAAWHAAATHASNHLVALLDQALDLAQTAGLSRDQARAALLPLLDGTLHNLRAHPPAEALTGPVLRGDVDVVARHLTTLAAGPADSAAAYRALARRALALARTRGTLTPSQLTRLETLLSEDTP